MKVSGAIESLKVDRVTSLSTNGRRLEYETEYCALMDAIGEHSTSLTSISSSSRIELCRGHGDDWTDVEGCAAWEPLMRAVHRAPNIKILCVDLSTSSEYDIKNFLECIHQCPRPLRSLHLTAKCNNAHAMVLTHMIRSRTCPLNVCIDLAGPYIGWTTLINALRNNWEVLDIARRGRCSACGTNAFASSYVFLREIFERNAALRWSNQHALVTGYCIALMGSGLSAYEMLWVVDWIPPFHHRFKQNEDTSVADWDPFHNRKIQLIARLVGSRNRIRTQKNKAN